MRFQLRRCAECGQYTLKDPCRKCGGQTVSAHPAKFSPDDKYARYRLAARYAAPVSSPAPSPSSE